MSGMVCLFLKIKKRGGFLWKGIEAINRKLVSRFFYSRFFNNAQSIIENKNDETPYSFKLIDQDNFGYLNEFILRQPITQFKYFMPDAFDPEMLKKLIQKRSILFIGCFYEDRMIGYCFLRLFFIRTCFIGRIVDPSFQSRGIGKQMSLLLYNIAWRSNFRIFSNINEKDITSLKSIGLEYSHVVEKFSNGNLLIEYSEKELNSGTLVDNSKIKGDYNLQ